MDWSGILKRDISVAGGDGFNVFLSVRLVDWPVDALKKETAKKIMYEHFDSLDSIPLGTQKIPVEEGFAESRPRLSRYFKDKKRYISYRIEKTGELK